MPLQAILFDFETTGLTLHPEAELRKQPHAIEFGAVLMSLDDGTITEEASILINPGIPISEEITKITGLTDADVADAPSFVQVLPQLRRMFAEAHCAVAHNLPFDRAILRGELARAQVTDFPWPQRAVCTVGLYKDQWGRNPRLTELYAAVMGKPLAQTHRALDDVKAMVEIAIKEQLWEVFV
jgi:DNA polymerase III epsilon subunit-like protein